VCAAAGAGGGGGVVAMAIEVETGEASGSGARWLWLAPRRLSSAVRLRRVLCLVILISHSNRGESSRGGLDGGACVKIGASWRSGTARRRSTHVTRDTSLATTDLSSFFFEKLPELIGRRFLLRDLGFTQKAKNFSKFSITSNFAAHA